MTDQFGPKLINNCVAKLSNSPAITGVLRLDLDEFDSQLNSPRLVQRFLNYLNSHEQTAAVVANWTDFKIAPIKTQQSLKMKQSK